MKTVIIAVLIATAAVGEIISDYRGVGIANMIQSTLTNNQGTMTHGLVGSPLTSVEGSYCVVVTFTEGKVTKVVPCLYAR